MARPKAEAFLAIEDSISRPLKAKLSKHLTTLVKRAITLAVEKKYEEAEVFVNSFRLSKVLEGESKRLKMAGMSAVLLGASRYGEAKKTEVAKRKTTPELLPAAQKQFGSTMVAMDETFRNQLQTALRASYELFDKHAEVSKTDLVKADARYLGIELDLTKLSKDQLVSRIVNTMTNGGRKSGDALIDIASSLYTSRMSSYGFLIESRFRKSAVYRVNEQLDNRTCPVCKRMHGKTFRVDQAYTRLSSLLKVTDPDELRAQAPWPKQDKESIRSIDKMTREELVEKGWDTPPYHPLCRGLLDYSDEVIEELEGAPIRDRTRPQTMAELRDSPFEFKGSSEEAMEDLWDRMFGRDLHPRDLLEAWGAMGPPSTAKVRMIGDSVFKIRMNTDLGDLTRVFGLVGDKVVVKHELFSLKESAQGAGLAKDLLSKSLDLYEKMGVSHINLDANVNVGGYAWARYGALPSSAKEVKRINGKMADRLSAYYFQDETLPLEDQDALKELISLVKDSDDPKMLWLVADSKFGKNALLGEDWEGRFDLADPDVMSRLNSYIGRR
jgi:hypothetical protein